MIPPLAHKPRSRTVAKPILYFVAFFAISLPAAVLRANPSIDFLPRSGSNLRNGPHGRTIVAQRCSLLVQNLEPSDFVQILIDGTIIRQAKCDGHAMMIPLTGTSLGWHSVEARVTRRRNREVTQTTKTVERFPDRETTTTVEEKLGNAEILYARPQFFEVVSQTAMGGGVRPLGVARLCSRSGEAGAWTQDANRFSPFSVMPTVRRIPDPQSSVQPAASSTANPMMVSAIQANSPAGTAEPSKEPDWVTFCFDDAARFRLPEFAQCGAPLQTVGAVIYEGMQFSVGPQGRYRVSFEIGAPAMPLKLRMQLCVLSESLGFQTVTLPPISIPSENPSAAQEGIYLVQHEGWHPALVDVDELHSITRNATTCRFGFGLDVP